MKGLQQPGRMDWERKRQTAAHRPKPNKVHTGGPTREAEQAEFIKSALSPLSRTRARKKRARRQKLDWRLAYQQPSKQA